MPTRRDELTRHGGTAVRRARLPRDVDGRPGGGARRAEGLALLAHRLEAGAPLRDDARGRARVPRALDAVPEDAPAAERSGSRCGATCASSPSSSTSRPCSRASGATSRASSGRRSWPSAAATRSASAPSFARASSGRARADLDVGAAALLVLSAANWAYTWLTPGRDTDELADRFTAILVDGIRGYAGPRPGPCTCVDPGPATVAPCRPPVVGFLAPADHSAIGLALVRLRTALSAPARRPAAGELPRLATSWRAAHRQPVGDGRREDRSRVRAALPARDGLDRRLRAASA